MHPRLRPFCPLCLLLLCAATAFAAPAPPAGPAPDALEQTLAIVEDLLSRFEETAASHHVLLVKSPAARRDAALQLVRLARRAAARNDDAMAVRCLGWAAQFPGAWWYQTALESRPLEVLLDAIATVEHECEAREGCTPYPAQGDGSEWKRFTSLTERRPYMPPSKTVSAADGAPETVLDFTHYPRAEFAVQVTAQGMADVAAEILPGAEMLRVPPALGVYSITTQTPDGPVTHQYRAAVVQCSGGGISLNGEPWYINASRLTGVDNASPSSARNALTAAMSHGLNLAIVAAPPPWLLDLAEELQLGLAIEPGILGPNVNCMLCAGGTGVTGFQERIAAHIQRYAEAPAVRIWLALPPIDGDATAALHAVYPMYRHLDVYERPVAYLGEGDTTGLDIATARGEGDAVADQMARAKKLDMPVFTIGAAADGAAGVVAGEVNLAGPRP